MIDTLNEILGTRADKDITNKIKYLLASEPKVRGVYDLIMYNYGPDKYYASVHLELPDTMTAKEIDKLTRKMEAKVYQETGVILVAVGLYSHNTGNGEAARIERDVEKKVLKHKWAVQFHGFYLDIQAKEMHFDVVLSFDIKPDEALKILHEEMHKAYSKYNIHIIPDIDVSATD